MADRIANECDTAKRYGELRPASRRCASRIGVDVQLPVIVALVDVIGWRERNKANEDAGVIDLGSPIIRTVGCRFAEFTEQGKQLISR